MTDITDNKKVNEPVYDNEENDNDNDDHVNYL